MLVFSLALGVAYFASFAAMKKSLRVDEYSHQEH